MADSFNPFSLEGKTILITGASSGIGKNIAENCANMGASVILNGRDTERLNNVLNSLPNENHSCFAADLTKHEGVVEFVNSIPKVDGVVHCAGIAHRQSCKLLQQSDFDFVMGTNFFAPALLQAELLSQKKINKDSSIVFISSRAAEFPCVGNALYSASKSAVVSYAKCLAMELAPRNIRVNCILPGMVWTGMVTDVLEKEDLDAIEQNYPLKRFGKVEDIAYLAVYLLSNASSWMTGSSIDISGGGEGILIS